MLGGCSVFGPEGSMHVNLTHIVQVRAQGIASRSPSKVRVIVGATRIHLYMNIPTMPAHPF